MSRATGRPEKPVDPGSPYAEFAIKLRRLRAKSGLTYRELAERTGYPATMLAEAARGQRLPGLELTQAFVTACGGSDQEWRLQWTKVNARTGRSDRAKAYLLENTSIRPEQISTHAEFVIALSVLRKSAGLSYRQVERFSDGRLRRSTLSNMLTGRAIPGQPRRNSSPSAPSTLRYPKRFLLNGVMRGSAYELTPVNDHCMCCDAYPYRSVILIN